MKRSTGVLMALLLVLVLALATTALAEDLSAEQVKALESVGVQVYPGASYTTGDNDVATIMWFKSKDSPDKIMAWYKEKLSGWSEMDVNGSRVIYKGPGGLEAKDLSTKPYIFTRTTDETPGSTDSEITVRIPR
ncbi:hypothetical protein MUP29_02515 [bacterium]|nr:hypothetical protein [bacterium]